MEWTSRTDFIVGKQNAASPALVLQEILMRSLHNKLRLLKQFVKAMDKELEACKHLVTAFHKLSEAMIKGDFRWATD